jgi:hypothetical protein
LGGPTRYEESKHNNYACLDSVSDRAPYSLSNRWGSVIDDRTGHLVSVLNPGRESSDVLCAQMAPEASSLRHSLSAAVE